MKWDVEYTDEFEMWWNRLGESEQDSVQASVMLLGDAGPFLGFPHTAILKVRAMATFGSYGCSTEEDLIVCSMPLTRAAAPFF